LFCLRADPIYRAEWSNYRETLNIINQPANQRSLVVVDAYNQPIWYFYFNFGFPKNEWVGLSPGRPSIQQKTIFHPRLDQTIQMLEQEMEKFDILWMVSEENRFSSADVIIERLLDIGFKMRSYRKIEVDKYSLPMGVWQFTKG
jgi:hypothetical protein